MTIVLYNNSSPANVVSKTISEVDTLSGTLREASAITDPVITIARSSPVGFNYFRIPEFNRYYFLKQAVVVNNNLIAISGHVDVLMSYASTIRAAQAIVFRQENVWNLYLDDGSFRAYQNPKHKIIRFPEKISDFSYVLALAGNNQMT